MDASGSMLKTIIERVRGFLDDPDLEAKYSDDYILRHIVRPAFASVMSRINNSSQSPIMHRLTLPLTKNVADYMLPPCVGEVWRLCVMDDSGRVLQEAIPRGVYNLRGPNWKIEGNMLSFLPYPNADYATMELWYIHSGDFSFVYSPGGASFQLNANRDGGTINISGAPTLGEWDKRPSAYVGQMLRIISTSTSIPIEERIITAWTPNGVTSPSWTPTAIWNFTLRKALTYTGTGTMPPFEIAPEGSENLWEAVAAASAMKLASYRKLSGEHFGMIQAAYRDAMKTTMDHYSNVQMRMPKSWEKDTVDNQLTQPWRI
jgi:hypothetical protein